MTQFGQRRVGIDLFSPRVAWVRSFDTPQAGPQVFVAGVDPTKSCVEKLNEGFNKRHAFLGQGRADIVLRGPEIHIQRINLPGISGNRAQQVAVRRKQEIEQGETGDEVYVSTLVVSDSEGSTIWLMSSLREICESIDFEITRHGFRVDRLVPHTLALGALTRLLPANRSKGLTAVVWVDPESGTCVIADRRGWLFDRTIPLKYAGDRMLQASEASLDPEGDKEYQQIERLATELERTFAYVEKQLNLGEVARIRLCGTAQGLDDLARVLAANLRLDAAQIGAFGQGDAAVSIPPEAGAALGAVMLPRPVRQANLLPPETLCTRAATRMRRPLMVALVLAIAFSVAIGIAGLVRYQAKRMSLTSARSVAQRWEDGREALAGQTALSLRADQARVAASLLDRSEPPWGGMLVVLGAAMPEILFVQQLDLHAEEQGWKLSVSLEGQAASQAELAAAVRHVEQQVRAHELFKLVSVESRMAPWTTDEGVLARYRLTAWVAPLSSQESPHD